MYLEVFEVSNVHKVEKASMNEVILKGYRKKRVIRIDATFSCS